MNPSTYFPGCKMVRFEFTPSNDPDNACHILTVNGGTFDVWYDQNPDWKNAGEPIGWIIRRREYETVMPGEIVLHRAQIIATLESGYNPDGTMKVPATDTEKHP